MATQTEPSWDQDIDTPLTFRRSDLERARSAASPPESPLAVNGEPTWPDRLVACIEMLIPLGEKYMLQKNLMPKRDQDQDPDQPPAFVGGTGVNLQPFPHPNGKSVESLEPVPEPVGGSHSGGPAGAEPPGKSPAPGASQKIYNQVLDLIGSLDQDAKVSDLAELMILGESDILTMIDDGLKDL